MPRAANQSESTREATYERFAELGPSEWGVKKMRGRLNGCIQLFRVGNTQSIPLRGQLACQLIYF